MCTLAVYGYFVFNLIGRQQIEYDPHDGRTVTNDADMVFPLFTSLEFIFYVGWLKVGEALR